MGMVSLDSSGDSFRQRQLPEESNFPADSNVTCYTHYTSVDSVIAERLRIRRMIYNESSDMFLSLPRWERIAVTWQLELDGAVPDAYNWLPIRNTCNG